jgi:hypothetical protein
MRHLDYLILSAFSLVAALCAAFLFIQPVTAAGQIHDLISNFDATTLIGGGIGALFLLIFGYYNRKDPTLVLIMVVIWLMMGLFYFTFTFATGYHLVLLPLST